MTDSTLVAVAPSSLRPKYELPDTFGGAEGRNLTVPQRYVPEYLAGGTSRALLAWHGLGTGKTCVGLRTMHAFLTRYPDAEVYVVVPSLELRRQWEASINGSWCTTELVSAARKKRGRIQVRTGVNFSNLVQQSTAWKHDVLVVVDEIHKGYIGATDAGDRGNSSKLRTSLATLAEALNREGSAKRACLLALTATPAYDSTSRLVETIDVLRHFDDPTETQLNYKETQALVQDEASLHAFVSTHAAGRISYVRGNDPTRFPVRISVGEDRVELITLPMTTRQRAELASAEPASTDSVDDETDDATKLSASRVRTLTCAAPPDKRSLAWARPGSLREYSPKFRAVIDCIQRGTGTALVAFTNLESEARFARALTANGFVDRYRAGKKRGNRPAFVRGSHVGRARRHFNSDKNRYGDAIRVMLLTPKHLTGLDFKNVRQIHLVERHWNRGSNEQAIARAIRSGSHDALPLAERNVVVALYQVVDPDDAVVDERRITDAILRKESRARDVLALVRSVAIDCANQYRRTVDDYAEAVRKQYPEIIDCFGARRAYRPVQEPPRVGGCVGEGLRETGDGHAEQDLRAAAEVMMGVLRVYPVIKRDDLRAFTKRLARTAVEPHHSAVQFYPDSALDGAYERLVRNNTRALGPDGRVGVVRELNGVVTIVAHGIALYTSRTPYHLQMDDVLTRQLPTAVERFQYAYDKWTTVVSQESGSKGVDAVKRNLPRLVVQALVDRMSAHDVLNIVTTIRGDHAAPAGRPKDWRDVVVASDALTLLDDVEDPGSNAVEYHWNRNERRFVGTDAPRTSERWTAPLASDTTGIAFLNYRKKGSIDITMPNKGMVIRDNAADKNNRQYSTEGPKNRHAAFKEAYAALFGKKALRKSFKKAAIVELAIRNGSFPSYAFKRRVEAF